MAEELAEFWRSELKIKRNEIQEVSRKAAKWKKKAKVLQEERDALRTRLNEKESTDCTELASECESLRNELLHLKEALLGHNPNRLVSKLSRYKERAKKAEAARRIAEATCEHLQGEIAKCDREDQSSNSNRLEQQSDRPFEAERITEVLSMEINMKTDARIQLALGTLPIVEDHPAENLESIGENLRATVCFLPERYKSRLKYLGQQSFAQTQILFTESNQHGYTLRPQNCLGQIWYPGNPLHRIEKPFEAFFEKTGIWYYIGTYQAFYICDAPWATFSRWTDQAVGKLVRATIVGDSRFKFNCNRINHVLQKYEKGEITAAYIGMQCVNFDHELYQRLLEASKEAAALPGRPMASSTLDRPEKRPFPESDTSKRDKKKSCVVSVSRDQRPSPSIVASVTVKQEPIDVDAT